MNNKIFNINIPITFDILMLENKKNNNDLTIILYNKLFSITLVNNKKKIKIDLESYSIRINTYINYNNNLLLKERGYITFSYNST